MYHETFWVAVSAAAPVIALAAIVAYTDANRTGSSSRQWAVDHPPWTYPPHQRHAAGDKIVEARSLTLMVVLVCTLDTILQAVMLAFSLSSLASRVDEMPTAVAVAGEVAGIVGLAACAWMSMRSSSRADDFKALSVPPAEGKGSWLDVG
jgi:hypothetical protein